jgi:hypothetical protein
MFTGLHLPTSYSLERRKEATPLRGVASLRLIPYIPSDYHAHPDREQ